jgi:nucleotide-binding universal stress UspA family protein
VFMRIVIALQKESEANDLAGWARRLAPAEGANVLSLHVRKVVPEADQALERYDDAEAVADAGAAAARNLGLPAESDTLTVDREHAVGRAVADVALGWRADVVVMGSRRLAEVGAALHGSVSHDVMRLAPCPVVVAGERPAALASILLAVDGSDAARAAELVAQDIAAEAGATVSVVHVPIPIVVGGLAAAAWYAPPPAEEPVSLACVDRLRSAGVHARQVDLQLYPPIAGAIAQAADHVAADLIVIGSRGLGEVSALVRGSVSHELLHATRRPVLVKRA